MPVPALPRHPPPTCTHSQYRPHRCQGPRSGAAPPHRSAPAAAPGAGTCPAAQPPRPPGGPPRPRPLPDQRRCHSRPPRTTPCRSLRMHTNSSHQLHVSGHVMEAAACMPIKDKLHHTPCWYRRNNKGIQTIMRPPTSKHCTDHVRLQEGVINHFHSACKRMERSGPAELSVPPLLTRCRGLAKAVGLLL